MFSPRHIVFWLAVALQGVNALNAANPYEMVYMYYAYKMEWASGVAPGNRRIAPGCTHLPYVGIETAPLALIENANLAAMATQGVSGICTFFDFWKYAGTSAWDKMWRAGGSELAKPGPTEPPLTRTIDPDADRIADVMNNPAKIGTKKLLSQPDKMWSATAIAEMGGGPAAAIPWAQQVQRASQVVETARATMANRVLADPGNTALAAIADAFEKSLGKAIDYLGTIHHIRTGDFSRYVLRDQLAHPSWASTAMAVHGVLDTVPYVHTDGTPSVLVRNVGGAQVIDTTFQVANFQKSWVAAAAAGTPLSKAEKQALKAFVTTYGTLTTTPDERNAKLHKDVLDVVKFARELHQTPLEIDLSDTFISCGE